MPRRWVDAREKRHAVDCRARARGSPGFPNADHRPLLKTWYGLRPHACSEHPRERLLARFKAVADIHTRSSWASGPESTSSSEGSRLLKDGGHNLECILLDLAEANRPARFHAR